MNKLDMSSAARFAEFGKKIVAVGRNYSEHAKELGNAVPAEPILFLKPTTSYITKGSPIILPKGANELHHEVELGVIISKKCKDISAADALSHIAGCTVALDMTDRVKQTELKNKGLPWSVAKGFDTSCPVGDFTPLSSMPKSLQALDIWLKVNNETKQSGNTKDMIFSVPDLVSYISGIFTLEPGDLVLTGTPAGVGPVKSGDVITAGIEGCPNIEYYIK
ncbi:oxaloacetate decarboxylase, mitochondrial-like [Watersipora subatra]|uniref:oxaloacetate decarboxylase, mitochondrial-like n=1 Tax=Watersipora subatra TaxID=2589382 RepID=UPI00355B668B